MNVDALKPFEFHGLIFTEKGNQAEADACPFCGGKLQVNLQDRRRADKISAAGMWDCWGCKRGGNLITFLNHLLESGLKSTKRTDYGELAKDRGIKPATLKQHRLCRSPITGHWLIPTHNAKGKLQNLHVYRRIENKMILMSTPQCRQHIYLSHTVSGEGPLWIAEGHWDGLALREMTKEDVVAVPGAGTFREQWSEIIEGRDICFAYDNDQAGKDGIQRALDTIKTNPYCLPNSIKKVLWRKSDVKDVRDLYLLRGDKAMSALENRLVDVELDVQALTEPEAIPRTTFEDLSGDFASRLHMTRDMDEALAIMLAVTISVYLKGDPLWIYLVGPPSSGKTTLAEAISGSRRYVYPMSKLTANSLASGWRPSKKPGEAKAQDPSVLPKLNGRTLIVKDFTSLLSLPITQQEAIYGILRDAYDGVYRTAFGSGVEAEYKTSFSLIACVTPEIRTINNSALGERFLQVEIISEARSLQDSLAMNMSAMEALEVQMKSSGETDGDFLQRCCLGYMNHLRQMCLEQESPPLASEDMKRKISALADFVAMMRAQVRRDGRGNVIVRPIRECGLRVSKQAYKLAVCLSIVLQCSITNRVFTMVRRCLLNTSIGFTQDVAIALLGRKSAMTTKAIAEKVKIKEKTAQNKLNDMVEMGLVTETDLRGKVAWLPSQELRQLWDLIKPTLRRNRN